MAPWHSRRDFLKRSIVWTIGTSWVGAALDAYAQAPQLLNYQGRLTDANGAARNGSFPMSFAILGGTSSWSEAQTVSVANGFFSVLLGSVTPFPADLFTSGQTDAYGPVRFLEVTVAGTPDPRTGAVLPLPAFEQLVKERVIDRLDHKHLNTDTQEFREVNPSVENIARIIWNLLQDRVAPARLHRVRVWETAKTSAEYAGG